MNKYFPNFCCKNNFDLFIENAILYKKRYGHLDIKKTDIIDDFPIGNRWWNIKKSYGNGYLSEQKIKQLSSVGFCFDIKHKKIFEEKIEIAEQAIKNGIIISNEKRIYNGVNFYTWISGTVKSKYLNKDLTQKEINVIENLLNKSIYEIFNNGGRFIKVVDIKNNCEIGVYRSKTSATKEIREKFGFKISNVSICNLINGKSKTPYKGRFMFYYATDEEIKKYLEEKKRVDFL